MRRSKQGSRDYTCGTGYGTALLLGNERIMERSVCEENNRVIVLLSWCELRPHLPLGTGNIMVPYAYEETNKVDSNDALL